MQSQAVETPKEAMNIFEYRAVSPFLQAAFRALHAEQKQRFSLRALSRRHGIRSVATLSMVINGKRKVTPEVAEKLALILKLRGVERRYFMALVDLEKCEDLHARAEVEDRLLAIRQGGSGRSLDSEQYKFLSEWHYVALFVLVGQPDFRKDPEYLSRRLRDRVSPKQVEVALDNMQKWGLISVEDGKLVQTNGPVVKTADDIKNLSVRKFQRTMIKRALEAIFMPVQQREITGLTLAVAKNQLPELKRRIRQFREELDEFAGASGTPDEVFQLNVQLFPLTVEAPK
ncbi:MAG: TIGR02147 family protein [Bdellovibrionales bacterium]|nr:TIGR02147 family protein [Bdellovibrionales bacterium]